MLEAELGAGSGIENQKQSQEGTEWRIGSRTKEMDLFSFIQETVYFASSEPTGLPSRQ